MSKRSGPDSSRPRSAGRSGRSTGDELLRLAGAVADGEVVTWSDGGDDPVVSGLQLIASLSERLGAVAGQGKSRSRARTLFQWGHLDVLERIGEGASSEVFRAYDPLLAVEVALKLSRPGLGWAGTAEWITEARRLARLRHPNIVAVHGVDRHDGRAGIWLDLVQGETLQDWGQRQGPLAARDLYLIGIELCRGLTAIHEAGLVHCDMKPANLLRDRDGRILITDFGAAASAQHDAVDGLRRGTPLTMAPEVLSGAAGSIASDLYGLGVVLYWLAVGRLPVSAERLEDLLAAHQRRRSGELGLDLPDTLEPVLVNLLARLLAVDPRERPDDASEVEQVLVGALRPGAGGIGHGDPARLPDTVAATLDRLVAREAELAYLQQEYRRSLGGHALPVLLAGETGSGKSALITRFADWLAASGGRLLRIPLLAHSAGPRLPVLLARALGLDDGDSRRIRTDDPTELVRKLRTAGPLVLCLDDLQHVDGAERAWIRRLAAELRASTVLLVGLVRTSAGQVPDVGGLFGDGPVGVLRLQPFNAVQSEMAIGELLGAPDYGHNLPASVCAELRRLSGGNPFFLSELLRHLITSGGLRVDHGRRRWQWQGMPGSLPASLELAALERCRALPQPGRHALDAAAVLGERFPSRWLAGLLGVDIAALRGRLVAVFAAGILEAVDDQAWAFRHGLIRQALYHAMAADHRIELHRRCVSLLHPAQGREDQAALSLHAERAGDPAMAFSAGYAVLIAGADRDGADPADYERLQALIDAAGVRPSLSQRWAIGLGWIRALRNLGRLHEAQAVAERVAAELRPSPGSAREDALRLERAQNDFSLAEHRRVLVELAPILAADGRRRPPARTCFHAARLLAVRAQAALGEYRLAERSLEQAMAEGGNRRRRQQLQTLYGWCLALQGRLARADQVLEAAMALARDAAPGVRADLLRRLHWVRLMRGRYQPAYALALAAHDAYRSIGDAMGQAKIRMALAQVRLCQGLTEEAVGYLHRTVYELGDIGDRHCEAETLWLLARAQTRLGELDRADGHLDQALQLIAEIGDRDDEFRFLTEQARLRLAQGRADQALACAGQARVIAAELDSLDGAALADIEIAAAHLAQGQAQTAVECCAPAAAQLHALGAGESWRGDWLLGRCRLALAQPDRAVSALASAQATVERIINEFGRGDEARRTRLCRAWQALVDDHATALDALGDDVGAERLRRRWAALDSSGQGVVAGSVQV